MAYGQRVWKVQPAGGSRGLATSPVSTMRSAARRSVHVGNGDGRQQRLGVRMARPEIDLLGVALLDDPAQVHHGDPVADVAHDRQVVGDEEEGQPEPGLEVGEEVDDLGLGGHVQRAHRFVAHEEPGPGGERPGDGDPLALTSGEFVRSPVQGVAAQADLVEELGHPLVALAARQPVVDLERFAHDVVHAHAGVERGVRILEDDLHGPPGVPQLTTARVVSGRAPSRTIDPSEGSTRRRISRASVDLPEPLSPTRPRVRPTGTRRSTPSTAFTAPVTRRSGPVRTGKVIFNAVTSSSGSASAPASAAGVPGADRQTRPRRTGRAPRDGRTGRGRR